MKACLVGFLLLRVWRAGLLTALLGCGNDKSPAPSAAPMAPIASRREDSAWSCVLLDGEGVEDGANAAAVEHVKARMRAEKRMVAVLEDYLCRCCSIAGSSREMEVLADKAT